jgi:hypothetical protein
VIENKQSREIADSSPLMISRTYDQRRETFRFVSRKIRFVFAVFGLTDRRNAMASTRRSSSSAPQIVAAVERHGGRRRCAKEQLRP